MTEEKVLQDNKTVEQIVDDMNLFDDDLMSMVFDGNIEAAGFWQKIIQESIIILKCRENQRAHIYGEPDLTAV